MKRYVLLDAENYVRGVSDTLFSIDGNESMEMELPDELNEDVTDYYRYAEGKLEFDQTRWVKRQREHAKMQRRQRLEQAAITRLQQMQAEQLAKVVTTPDDVITLSPLLPAWEQTKYSVGDIVTYDGAPYKCIQVHNSTGNPKWNPAEAVSLWSNYHATSAGCALPWIQPTGAHDGYQTGEWMIWTDEKTYKCTGMAVVHGPDTAPQLWKAMQ